MAYPANPDVLGARFNCNRHIRLDAQHFVLAAFGRLSRLIRKARSAPVSALLNFPIQRESPIRLSVGYPEELTSNSWKFFVEKDKGNAYIVCRDNFQIANVSLHNLQVPGKGKFYFGLTAPAWRRSGRENRFWDIWDEPAPHYPQTTMILSGSFQLPDWPFDQIKEPI